MHTTERMDEPEIPAAGSVGPELGPHSMLRMIAAMSPRELPRFVSALVEAISRWTSEDVSAPCGDPDAELTRLHALKSITSALGSPMIAKACDDLGECVRSGATVEHIRRRSQRVAAAAQRLLQRSIVPRS